MHEARVVQGKDWQKSWYFWSYVIIRACLCVTNDGKTMCSFVWCGRLLYGYTVWNAALAVCLAGWSALLWSYKQLELIGFSIWHFSRQRCHIHNLRTGIHSNIPRRFWMDFGAGAVSSDHLDLLQRNFAKRRDYQGAAVAATSRTYGNGSRHIRVAGCF